MDKIIQPSIDDPSGWGAVPALNGNVIYSEPGVDPVTGVPTPSATQEQQTSIANQTAVSQTTFLAPAPIQTPLIDMNGHMTAPWVVWFQQLFRRVGEAQSTPSGDIDILTEFDDIPQTVRMPDVYDYETSSNQGLSQINDLAILVSDSGVSKNPVPSQKNHEGQFLSTNGTNTSWQAIMDPILAAIVFEG